MIVYDSLCNFSQVAGCMTFPVQVFKWTACPCQVQLSLEPRASMNAKLPTPFLKSIKYCTKWIMKRGSMFWILLSSCDLRLPAANSTSQRKARTIHMLQHASSIKLYTCPSNIISNCSSKANIAPTLIYTNVLVHECTIRIGAWIGFWPSEELEPSQSRMQASHAGTPWRHCSHEPRDSPEPRSRQSRGWVTAVTNPTLMSHGRKVQSTSAWLQANLVHPLQVCTGSESW